MKRLSAYFITFCNDLYSNFLFISNSKKFLYCKITKITPLTWYIMQTVKANKTCTPVVPVFSLLIPGLLTGQCFQVAVNDSWRWFFNETCLPCTHHHPYYTVLLIRIMKVRDFMPQNITQKPALYSLCDIYARHSQAQNFFWSTINPSSRWYEILSASNLTESSNDYILTDYWLTDGIVDGWVHTKSAKKICIHSDFFENWHKC